ncbi:MAG: hypothetical protein AAGE52_25895 [Myxococcota bacterium]
MELIGRAALRSRVESLLDDGEVLITLHGPPGVGKSALAARLSRDATLRVSFAGATEDDVDQRVASALALSGSGGLERVEDAWRTAVLDLVVFDDVESVLSVLAKRLPRWLEASGATFVIASQTVLNVDGEFRVAVDPLGEADAGALLARHFARLSLPAPTPAQTEAILAHLDGLPLAIELAAARALALTPKDLVVSLEATRGRTLDVALDASFAALPERLRQFLGRLALLPGPIDLALASLAAGAEDALQGLVERSLLQRSPSGFRILEVVRGRALRELVDRRGEREVATALAKRGFELAQPPWGPRDRGAFQALAKLRGALVAALAWEGLDAETKAKLATVVAVANETRLPVRERRRMLQRWPRRWEGAAPETNALYGCVGARTHAAESDAGSVEAMLGDEPAGSLRGVWFLLRAMAAFLKGQPGAFDVAMMQPAADRVGIWARAEAAYLHHHQGGDAVPVVQVLDDALRWATMEGDTAAEARFGTLRGLLALDRGEAGANRILRDALEATEALGEDASPRLVEFSLALAAQEAGQHDEAFEAYARAIRSATRAGTPRSAATCEAYRATLLVEAGRAEEAKRALREAIRAFEAIGDERSADFFEAVLAFTEGRPAAPDRAKDRRDPGELAARQKLAALAAGEKEPEGPSAEDWHWRFAGRLEHPSRTLSSKRSLAWDGARFRVDKGAWVELTRRPTLRRLLDALVRADAPMSKEELFAAAWPGEAHTKPGSAARRVHTAVRRLRQLGLGDVLSSDREGYWIDRPLS